MKVFLIVVAVIAVIIIALLSLSVTVTVVYDKKWVTKVRLLFIEKEVSLSKILSFVLFPEKAAEQTAKEHSEKKDTADTSEQKAEPDDNSDEKPEEKTEKKEEDKKPAKPNPIAKLWNEQGVVGIFSLVTNLAETANSAIITLIRGLHIYSLYVMIIVGGYDADMIGRAYGKLCECYYPFKGIILNQMRVDNYDDYIVPDFLAERTETEFQLIASINVKLVLKLAINAGYVFLKNLIKNKKELEK